MDVVGARDKQQIDAIKKVKPVKHVKSDIDEINIVQIVQQTKQLSQVEREELFITWSKQFKTPLWFFNELGTILDQVWQQDAFRTRSDMLMLKIRKICNCPMIIPIVGKKRQVVTTDSIKIRTGGFISGGDSNEFSVETFFIESQCYIYSDPKLKSTQLSIAGSLSPGYSISCGETAFREGLDVVGFMFDGSRPLLPMDTSIYANIPSIVSQIKSGAWTTEFLQNNLYKPYSVFKHKLIQLLFNSSEILFKSDVHANTVCDQLLDMLDQFIDELRINWIEWKMYNSIEIALNGSSDLITIPPSAGPSEVNVEKLPKNPIDKFLEVFDDVFPIKLNSKFNSNVWSDFMSLGRMDIMSRLYLRTLGYKRPDDIKYIDNAIEQRKIFNLAHNASAQHEYNLIHLKYIEMQYRWYYIKQFGFEKFMSTMSYIPTWMAAGVKLRNYVEQRENKIILTNIARDDALQKIVSDDDWVALVKRMRYETSHIVKKSLYTMLRKSINAADLKRAPSRALASSQNGLKENDFLRTPGDLPIICPHIRDEYENLEDPGLRDYLIMCYSTSDTTLEDAYYCRICGEELVRIDLIGITTASSQEGYGHNDDELRKYIWKQLKWILSGTLEFKQLQTPETISQIVSDITNKLYNFIDQIEKKLTLSKTMTKVEYENYKRLLTTIYIYGMFVKLIIDNPASIKFNGSKSRFGRVKPDNLIKNAVERIMLTQNTIINTMPNITEEYVAGMLLKAYDAIQQYVGKAHLANPEPIGLINYIITDPLYWFLTAQYQTLTVNTPAARAQAAMTKTVLGKSLDAIKLDGIYDAAPNPYKGINVEYHNKQLQTIVAKEHNITEIFRKIYYPQIVAVTNWLLDYTKSGVYNSPYWKVTIDRDPSNRVDVITSSVNPDYLKFAGLHNHDCEANLGYLWQTHRCLTYSNLYDIKYLRKYPGFKPDGYKYLAFEYGTDFLNKAAMKIINPDNTTKHIEFHKHNWNYTVHIPLSEYRRDADITHYKSPVVTKSKSPVVIGPDQVMIDRYCGICYNGWSSITDRYKDIKTVLEEEQLIDGFYNLFLKRCPIPKDAKHGDMLHNYLNNTCNQCGLTPELIEKHDREYFKKYLKEFKLILISDGDIMDDHAEIVIQPILTKYKPNPNIVNEFISTTYTILKTGSGLKDSPNKPIMLNQKEYSNLITYMGLIVDMDYDSIKKGIRKPDLIGLRRRVILHPYIQNLIIELSKFVNHNNFIPSTNMKFIISSASSSDLESLSRIHPRALQDAMGGDYYFLSEQVIANYDYDTQGAWTLEYLLHFLLKLYETLRSKPKISEAIQIEIMTYLIRQILSADEASARIKPQKRAELEAIQSTGEVDPNNIDNDQSRMFDTLVDPDQSDKYGFEEMDYGGENDDINT